MISTPTTLVVGAGGSCNLNLPTGNKLRQIAVGLGTNDVPLKFLRRHLQLNEGVIDNVLAELRADPGAESIDAFLVSRQDRPEVMQVGRGLIALLLGQIIAAHNKTVVRPNTDDWLGHVIGRMRDGARTCSEFLEGNKGVRFVTFNFERNIENRFDLELSSMFPLGPAKAITAACQHFAPVHVHGELPAVPACELFDDYGQSKNDWPAWLKIAASNVKVVMDDIDLGIVDRARRHVRQAKVLCFVGFGYGRDNVQRLGLTPAFFDGPHVDMYGSAQGLYPADRARVEGRLPGIVLNSGGCLDILRDQHVLRD